MSTHVSPPARVQAVIFDLDGTLLDTLEDIAAAANAALAMVDAPPHPPRDYWKFIGEGVQRLFEQSLPSERRNAETVERCAAAFEETYAREWDRHSRPYPGIAELLDELTRRSIQLAVLSNKPHEFTAKCVEHYLAAWPFVAVLGPREGVPRKPDPTGVNGILAQMKVSPEECLYVGDSGIDMQTANNARLYAVGVSWGLRPVEELQANGAHCIIDRPAELLELLPATTP